MGSVSKRAYAFLSIGLLLLAVIVAALIDDVGTAYTFLGSCGTMIISQLLPPLCILLIMYKRRKCIKLSNPSPQSLATNKGQTIIDSETYYELGTKQQVVVIFSFIIGIVNFTVSISANIMKMSILAQSV